MLWEGVCVLFSLHLIHQEKNLGPGSSHKLYLFYDYDHAKVLLISDETAKESPSGGAWGDLPAGFLSLCVCLGMAQLSKGGGSTGSPGKYPPRDPAAGPSLSPVSISAFINFEISSSLLSIS